MKNNDSLVVNIKKAHKDAIIPKLATSGAAAFDLCAVEKYVIEPKCGRIIVSTGLIFDIPEGYCLKILPRSGMAANNGITVLNAPGLVDEDFFGVVGIVLCNTSNDRYYTIEPKHRVAQGRIEKNINVIFNEVDEVSETDRDPSGFGSTGK